MKRLFVILGIVAIMALLTSCATDWVFVYRDYSPRSAYYLHGYGYDYYYRPYYHGSHWVYHNAPIYKPKPPKPHNVPNSPHSPMVPSKPTNVPKASVRTSPSNTSGSMSGTRNGGGGTSRK